jgi:hypothetical protein
VTSVNSYGIRDLQDKRRDEEASSQMADEIRPPRTCLKHEFRTEEGYGNALPYSGMEHPFRTLLYDLLVEPILRSFQRISESTHRVCSIWRSDRNHDR